MIKSDQDVLCPLCGANNYQIRFPATRYSSSGNSFWHFCCTSHYLAQHGDIVQCRACGMTYNNPQPKAEELFRIYKNIQDPRYVKEKSGRESTFTRTLQELHFFCKPPGKLLDIGCYTGTFMEVSAHAGWEAHGVELSSWAAKIARESGPGPVYEGVLSHIPLPENSFDVVTLWDVIEHLQQPTAILDRIAKVLKSGGILALSTYVIDSWPAQILGRHYPFFMDMHLVHFSRKTLRRMLAEHGYTILSITPHQRILRVQYFLEQLENMLPFGHSVVQWLAKQQWIKDKFIKISFSGLVNIFARCVK